jgi:hypothetical protein
MAQYHTRGPALPVWAVEPLLVANPFYTRGPADPVYFVPGPDGDFIPLSMINPAWFVRRDGSTPLTGDWDVGATYGIDELRFVEFSLAAYTGAHQEGRLHWDDDNGTLSLGMPGGNVELQIGLENLVRVRNTTGVQIDNGSIVYITGASGNNPLIALADASDGTKSHVIGIATEDIGHNSNGYVTTFGLVRDVNTNGLGVGSILWLSATTPGAYTTTRPTAPNMSVEVGHVIVDGVGNGVILAHPTEIPNMAELSDVLYDATPADNEFYAWNAANSRFELVDPVTSYKVRTISCLHTYLDVKARNQEQHIHGSFDSLSTGDALDSGTDIDITNGIGKIVIVVNAGSDFDGTITVTGTKVDRDTGAETPAFSENIVIDALTTDASSTDANGNTVHDFTGAYITANWYFGDVTISTANVTLTDVDTYGIAFEQLNDDPTVELETIDLTMDCTNTAAWCDLYFYLIEVTAPKCDISTVVDMHITTAESEADRTYRLRRSLNSTPMDGTTNGGWAELNLGPLNLQYWEDINFKLWFSTLSDIEIS